MLRKKEVGGWTSNQKGENHPATGGKTEGRLGPTHPRKHGRGEGTARGEGNLAGGGTWTVRENSRKKKFLRGGKRGGTSRDALQGKRGTESGGFQGGGGGVARGKEIKSWGPGG